MSEREPGWYWVRRVYGHGETVDPWAVAEWGRSTRTAHKSYRWYLNTNELDDSCMAEIGPRILPPGSDPSPAPCLDAKEMMRDVFTSWLKHRAAILSPAEPAAHNGHVAGSNPARHTTPAALAHTTQLLQDDIEKVLLERRLDKRLVGYTLETAKELAGIANAFATSAVEQERQACAEAGIWAVHDVSLPVKTDNLTIREIVARAVNDAIRSRSAEPPNTEGGTT